MSGRSRCLLSLSKIDNFAAWAATHGWQREETKGAFEVLRLRKDGKLAVYYKRLDAKEHATVFGVGARLVRDWLRERRNEDA